MTALISITIITLITGRAGAATVFSIVLSLAAGRDRC